MKSFFVIALGLVCICSAQAQDDISQSTGIIGNGRYLGAKTSDGQGTVPVLGVDSSGNTQVNALSGKTAGIYVAKTPIATGDADSFNPVQDIEFPAAKLMSFPAPAVMTPSTSYPTPAAGTLLTERVTIIATAAPTAAFVELARATAIPLSRGPFAVLNYSANPVAIVPRQGSTVNVLAAGTPYSCATQKLCECRKVTADGYWCTSQ